MDKLITHILAADVDAAFAAAAAEWPVWDSKTHPQVSVLVHPKP
jgi:hypothetical protein